MKNLFQQTSFGHCTVYAMANMFRNDLFLQFLTDEFKGCDDVQEKQMIETLDSDFGFSEVISIRHSYNIPIPERLLYLILMHQDPKDEGEDHQEFDLIPYLLAVRRKETHEFWHSVVVFNRNGKLYYIDPYIEDIIPLTDSMDREDLFIDCWSVKRLYRKSDDRFLRLSSQSLGFKFE